MSEEEETTELFDTPEELEKKVEQLASMIQNASHLVVYTGAGISTSAKIPDFRGPKGVWTLQEKGEIPKMEIEMTQAIPTRTHMALVKLQNDGIMKYLVSQNVDGLHRRSGIDPAKFSELHGNIYLEICEDCGMEYLRNYSVTEKAGTDIDTSKLSFRDMVHMTGRLCSDKKCRGILRDSIINFGESLPVFALKQATAESKVSDLGIVLGSSCRVEPAASLPKLCKQMVIVNLQKTPLDGMATLRIFHKTDVVIEMLMKKLGLEIPEFQESLVPTSYKPTNPEALQLRKPPPPRNENISNNHIESSNSNSGSSCTIL